MAGESQVHSAAAPALSLFTFTVRQALAERRVLLVLVLLFSPALLALTMRWAAGQPDPSDIWQGYQGLQIFMLLGGALPMAAMLYAPALLIAEAESGTLVYLFTRRLRRWAVLLIRFAALGMVLSGLGMAAVTAVHYAIVGGLPAALLVGFGTVSPGSALQTYLSVVPLAAAGFLAIFAVINLVTNKALLVSGMYLVAIELVIANVPADLRAYTMSHQVRRSVAGAMPAVRGMFRMKDELADRLYPAGDSGLWPVVLTVGVLLLITAILATRKELSARRSAGD